MVNYLSEVDILTINARIIQREGEKHQVSHVRDAEALHFLIEQPKQISFGQELYPTFSSKAGILLIKLIKKHVFDDHLKCSWKELADYTLSIAQVDDSELEYTDIYHWVSENIKK